MGKIALSGEPIRNGISDDEILMGFDRMTDAEIMYTLDRSPYPVYMGGKAKEWLQRRKTRAKAFLQKVGKKYKKLPTWAKVLTAPLAVGAALPLAAAAIPAAAGLIPAAAGAALPIAAAAAPAAPFGAAALAKRRADKLRAMSPAQRAAESKKRKRRLGIAAALVPGLGLTALTAVGAAKGIKAIRQRRKSRLAKRQAARKKSVSYVRAKPGAAPVAVTSMRAPAAMAPVPMKAVPVPQDADEDTGAPAPAAAAPEQKKGGLGGLLGLGALAALPFLLGS